MEGVQWTSDKENVLECIRQNAVLMSNYHKKRFLYYKNQLKYYRIPLIIISGINSVVSVGMVDYLAQGVISGITCLLSLICSIIGSIELFLNISAGMEQELNSSKDFYLLSVDIFKILSLTRENRPPNASHYLEEKYSCYTKLIESSQVVNRRLRDSLAPLPVSLSVKISSGNSSGSDEEKDSL
jgi:hypothetical protein